MAAVKESSRDPVRGGQRKRRGVFSSIYRTNRWEDPESASGTGSTLRQTSTLRRELASLFAEMRVRSVLDAPCGDLNWMKKLLKLKLIDRYIGLDIVPELIARNRERYGETEAQRFLEADIVTDDLPRVDLVLCRDCLVHLSLKDGISAIRNFKRSRSAYLLATTFPGLLKRNQDIRAGEWRPIDLQLPPFSLPPPTKVVNERNTEAGDYKEKSLGLWRLEDVRI